MKKNSEYKTKRMLKVSEKIIRDSKVDIHKDVLISFVKSNVITLYSFNISDFIKRLSAKQRKIGNTFPIYMDHQCIFRNPKTNSMCFTYQPNIHLHDNVDCQFQRIKVDAEKWAAERGLVADVYNSQYSWHKPGPSFLVIIHSPSVDIVPPDISITSNAAKAPAS